MVYGAAVPTLTASYSGFVNGDTSAKLSTQPTLRTTATATSPVGSYTTTASGAVDANYTIAYKSGTLTVSQATPIVLVNPVTIPSGTALANNQLTGTATTTFNGGHTAVPGTLASTTASGVLGVGTYTEAVTFTPTDTTDYTTVSTTTTA